MTRSTYISEGVNVSQALMTLALLESALALKVDLFEDKFTIMLKNFNYETHLNGVLAPVKPWLSEVIGDESWSIYSP